MTSSVILVPHSFRVALLQPQIAPNTGNIARLCVATGTELHLVRPMGFVLSDRELRRSAMDYWPRLRLTVHDHTTAFLDFVQQAPVWFFSSHGDRTIWQADFRDGDWLVFGPETKGIDGLIFQLYPDRVLRIPQAENERCLNLATAVGIGLYEALRQRAATRTGS
jgi:tRNA (cytidine/uridine-2'-O-)-methyltransferase